MSWFQKKKRRKISAVRDMLEENKKRQYNKLNPVEYEVSQKSREESSTAIVVSRHILSSKNIAPTPAARKAAVSYPVIIII